MSKQTFELTYSGYWRERAITSVPHQSGVYTVYRGTFNAAANIVNLSEILYIGESQDVGTRLQGHERTSDWRRHLRRGEELIFNFAPVSRDCRIRVEAALINHHKPPTNVEYARSFPFDETTVTTEGGMTLLSSSFTVRRSARESHATWR